MFGIIVHVYPIKEQAIINYHAITNIPIYIFTFYKHEESKWEK